MSSYIDTINSIRDEIYDTIDDAGIKNTKGISVTLCKKTLPPNFSKDDCPLVAIFKKDVSSGQHNTDQCDVELPRVISIWIAISDFAMDDIDEAESSTDDLIQKIIEALVGNPTLNGLARSVDVDRIEFDEDRRENVWFSEPHLEIRVACATI